MKNTTLIGKAGEDAACKYLLQSGYKIIDRNFKTRFGEIDILAEKDGFLAIVEVKKRKNTNFGRASEAVSFTKRQKIIKASLEFLALNTLNLQPRFDVIEINANKINHITNAFEYN